MTYEFTEQLQELNDILDKIDELIDNEDFFDSEPEKFSSELKDFLQNSVTLLKEVMEEDPQIPVSHERFFSSTQELLGTDQLDYKKVQNFRDGVMYVLKGEMLEILDDGDQPKRELFDQLTIPIMSLVNHQMHPTRPGYLVYHFKVLEQAEYFEELLTEKGLFYERFDENRKGEEVYWFGVRDRDHDDVEIINYTVKGKFRKPMIHDKGARYVVVVFGIIIVLIAIIGAIMSNT